MGQNYDDPKLEFLTLLYFSEDDDILAWRREDRPPDESKQTTVGTIYLTIYTDLCEYAEEDETHVDILAVLRPISDQVLFDLGTTGSKMSELFSTSASIRKTFVELLGRIPGVCGVLNCEDWGELFWMNGHTIDKRIEAPYLLPGPRNDDRWEP